MKRRPLNKRLKSTSPGVVRNISGKARKRVKKLAFRRTMVSPSKTKAGSLMVAKARTAEAREKVPSGIERRISGNPPTPQSVLRTNPPTFPKLEIMESLAKAFAHFPFCSVSMINRLSGVAAAAEVKEKTKKTRIGHGVC